MPRRRNTRYRTIILYGGIIGLGLFATFYYGKYRIEQWFRAKNLDVHIASIYPSIKAWGKPALTMNGLTIKNLDPNAGYKSILIDKITFIPLFFPTLKSLLKHYTLSFEVNGLKINEHNEMYLDVDNIAGKVNCHDDFYQWYDVNLAPLHFGLSAQYVIPAEDESPTKQITHLFLERLTFEGDYSEINRIANVNFTVSKQHRQPGEKKDVNYFVSAKGTIYYINLPDKNIPMRGDIKFNINKLPNLLEHLQQALVISSIAKNLGSILGYPFPKRKLTNNEIQEIMTQAITLKLRITPDAAYIGPIQVYP